MESNEKRKVVWVRKEAVDAMMAEASFGTLSTEEQDVCVLSVMLDVPQEVAARCVRGEAAPGDLPLLWEEIDWLFKYGKRSALRPLKDILSRHESLKKPKAWSADAFGEGGYTVVPPEEEEEYRRRAMENEIALRQELYACDCKSVWDGSN